MIKIALVDNQVFVRKGIKSLLENESDLEVITEAPDAKEALRLLKHGEIPDLLITAVNMPDIGGIELAKKARAIYPGIKILMLCSFEEDRYIIESFRAGALGYMLKSAGVFELLFAIRHLVIRNEPYLCSKLSMRLVDKLLLSKGNKSEVNVDDIIISQQDAEIISLLSEGFTNQEIANKLFTSKRTIESHRQVLIEKTGTRNTAALIRYALLNNVIY